MRHCNIQNTATVDERRMNHQPNNFTEPLSTLHLKAEK